MSQIALFPSRPFLKDKFGPDLFSDVPNKPGVYKFFDAAGALIYAGKAKNLRRRLYTYRNAKSGSCTRKEAKLISNISTWGYTVLETEMEAILEENRTIREYRPIYNHANKSVEAYYFIHLVIYSSGVLFELSMSPKLKPDKGISQGVLFGICKYPSILPNENIQKTATFGCFKGHLRVRSSLGALLQLLWLQQSKTDQVHFLPNMLTRNLTPNYFFLPLDDFPEQYRELLIENLIAWFGGSSDAIIKSFAEMPAISKQIFNKQFISERIEVLWRFYTGTLVTHRQMRENYMLQDEKIIKQNELDDILVKLKM